MINGLLDILFPPLCTICQRAIDHDQVLCTHCIFQLPYIQAPCDEQHPSFLRYQLRTNINYIYASFYLTNKGIFSELMHQYKYLYKKKIGKTLSNLAAEDIAIHFPQIQTIDYIIPVPSHPKKIKKRGFNPTEIIAKIIAERFNISYEPNTIRKIKHTPSQTSKSRTDRMANIKGTFMVKATPELEGKHVLLLDDILTTGSTIESNILTLQQIPGIQISVYTLAIADF